MGTDRTEYCRTACLCGNGEFVAEHCSNDHPYSSGASWFELHIECGSCSKEYVLQDRSNKAVVVRKADVDEREAKRKEYYAKAEEVMQSSEAQAYLREFEDRIAAFSTMADQHRSLNYAGLNTSAIQTFRKDVKQRGIRNVTRGLVSHYNFPQVLQFLGHADDPLVARLAELKAAYEESQRDPEVVSEMGCTLTLEAFFNS